MYRRATQVSEARIFRNFRAADDVKSALYCSCSEACCVNCDDVEPDHAPAHGESIEIASEEEEEDSFDEDDLLIKMRQARIRQIQMEAAAAKQAEISCLGQHQRVGEVEFLQWLQEAEAIIVHVTQAGDETCEHIESVLRQVHPRELGTPAYTHWLHSMRRCTPWMGAPTLLQEVTS